MTFTGDIVTSTGQECDVYREAFSDITKNNDSDKYNALKKHVAIIHCGNTLTLLQHKIANALLFSAKNHLLTKEEHSIHVQDLSNLIGYDSKDFKSLKNAFKALVSTVIEWNLLDEQNVKYGDIWIASSMISEVSIQGPICTYSYSKKMRELLYRPDVYGRIDMETQAKFKSTYGLALYENCIRYQNLKQTPWIPLEKFRKMMGVSMEKYPIFRDFKKRVLDVAINEVNNYAPIILELNTKKQGRAVIALKFSILHKSHIDLVSQEKIIAVSGAPNDDGCNDALIARLINDFVISKKVAISLLNEYSAQYIEEKIAIVTKTEKFAKGEIKAVAGYLISAIKNDFLESKSSKSISEKKQNELYSLEKKREHEEKRFGELKDKYNFYVTATFESFWISIEEKKQHELICEWLSFYKENRKPVYNSLKKTFDNHGINNSMVRGNLMFFLKEYHHDIYPNISSFEEFIKSNL